MAKWQNIFIYLYIYNLKKKCGNQIFIFIVI